MIVRPCVNKHSSKRASFRVYKYLRPHTNLIRTFFCTGQYLILYQMDYQCFNTLSNDYSIPNVLRWLLTFRLQYFYSLGLQSESFFVQYKFFYCNRFSKKVRVIFQYVHFITNSFFIRMLKTLFNPFSIS